MQSQVRSVHEAFTYAPNQIVRSHTACRSRSDKHLRASPVLPTPEATFRNKSNILDQGHPLEEFYCIQVCAGSGRLTAALKAVGLKNRFGVDCKLRHNSLY